SSKFMC
ncbi:peptidase S41 family protein, partial [Vibrio parahaemolyticus VP2007-007]